MTENEAIEELKLIKHTRIFIPSDEVWEMAIQALSEIQQYRAIGTVKQFEWCKDASHWKELFKDKLEQYEAIGTVEEIKSYFNENRKAGYKHGFVDGYNKAIDEFAEKLSLEISESIIWGMLSIDCKDSVSDEIFNYVIDTSKQIAEQMKAGGENE